MTTADLQADLRARRLAQLEEKKALLEKRKARQEMLPHLYGWKWYSWAFDYFMSRNRYNFLVAANQISKSTTQIRKAIHWATATELWPELWTSKPTQFWYLYPDLNVATVEFKEKWVKEILPSGEMKDDSVYGWQEEWKNKQIYALHFRSGVTIYFKSYSQDEQSLQTSSVYAIFCDEELPEHLYSELNARISAPMVNGYFHMVFTATIGQEMWRCTMEEQGTRYEKFKGAFKRQVSMYDCLTYMDGSASAWTAQKIEEIKASCKSESEVQRRVYGRFVVDENRKYASFSRAKSLKPDHKLPKEWRIYAGVDIGSGGSAHPAAIVFIGVNKTFTLGRVFKGWRGDGVITDPSDILTKFLELRGTMKPVLQVYDHQSKDFHTVSSRRGIPFIPANKGRDAGEDLLNTLFRTGMLAIYETPELMKLVIELETLKNSTAKPSAKDDLIDALRFTAMAIPWDFAHLNVKQPTKKDPHAGLSERERMRRGLDKEDIGLDLIEAEIDLFNECLDYDFY